MRSALRSLRFSAPPRLQIARASCRHASIAPDRDSLILEDLPNGVVLLKMHRPNQLNALTVASGMHFEETVTSLMERYRPRVNQHYFQAPRLQRALEADSRDSRWQRPRVLSWRRFGLSRRALERLADQQSRAHEAILQPGLLKRSRSFLPISIRHCFLPVLPLAAVSDNPPSACARHCCGAWPRDRCWRVSGAGVRHAHYEPGR